MPRYTDFSTVFWGRKDIKNARILMYYWRRKIREGDMTDNALMNYWKSQAYVSWEYEHRAPSQAVRPEKKPRVRKPYVRRTRKERPHPAIRRDAPKRPKKSLAQEKKPAVAAWVPTEIRWD